MIRRIGAVVVLVAMVALVSGCSGNGSSTEEHPAGEQPAKSGAPHEEDHPK